MHSFLRWAGLFVLFALLAASRGPAQTAGKESLLIGPGDLLQVDVLDTPEMTQQIRVSDQGAIALAYIGSVQVAGGTPADAASTITAALMAKQVMHHPQVTVRVQEYATGDVSVLGQVRTPGSYPITTPQTILKVLSLAGGLTDAADRQVSVERHGSSERTTYYLSNDPGKAVDAMVLVNPGDTVLVPKAPVVYVMGDVSRPGGYSITTNNSRLTVLQAISQAGSANKTSVQSKVRLIRTTAKGQVEIPIRLDAIEKGRQPDIALEANDVLYVPFSWVKNAAIGSASIAASTAGAALYLAR